MTDSGRYIRGNRFVDSWRRLPLLSENLDFTHVPNKTFNLTSELVLTWLIKVSIATNALHFKWKKGDVREGIYSSILSVLTESDIDSSAIHLYGSSLISPFWKNRFRGILGFSCLEFFPLPDPFMLVGLNDFEDEKDREHIANNVLLSIDFLINQIVKANIFKYGRLTPQWDQVLSTYSFKIRPIIKELMEKGPVNDLNFVSGPRGDMNEEDIIKYLAKRIVWSTTNASNTVFVSKESALNSPTNWVLGSIRKYLTPRLTELEFENSHSSNLIFYDENREFENSIFINKNIFHSFESSDHIRTKVAGARFKYAAMRLGSSVWSAPIDSISDIDDVLPNWVKIIGVDVLEGKILHRVEQSKNGMPRRLIVKVCPGEYDEKTRFYDAAVKLNEFNHINTDSCIDMGIVPFRRNRSYTFTPLFSKHTRSFIESRVRGRIATSDMYPQGDVFTTADLQYINSINSSDLRSIWDLNA